MRNNKKWFCIIHNEIKKKKKKVREKETSVSEQKVVQRDRAQEEETFNIIEDLSSGSYRRSPRTETESQLTFCRYRAENLSVAGSPLS